MFLFLRNVQGETFVWTYPRFFYHYGSKKKMYWFFIVVIALLAYFYMECANGKKAEKLIIDKTPYSADIVTKENATSSMTTESFASTGDVEDVGDAQTFELLDYLKPTLRTDTGKVMSGTNRIVVWDSARVNTLRKRFRVQNVLQRMEFQEGDLQIEVYRAVNGTGLDTYVFPRAGDDDSVIELERKKTSDDPSETESTNKIRADKMNVFLSDASMIPQDLLPMIRELEVSYKTRQSSSGPKAVDTHRS